MTMTSRRDFLTGAAVGLAAAAMPGMARGGDESRPAQFKTVLRKALIRKRLTPDVVKTLKENGYPGVELMDKKVSDAEARAARHMAEEEGLQIHSFMGGWLEFNAKDPAKRKASIEEGKRDLRLAKAYGASTVLIVAGRVGGMPMPKPHEFRPQFDPESLILFRAAEGDFPAYVRAQNDATKYAQDAVAELAPIAAELGVTIGLENVWNNLWVTPELASALIRSFKNPWVKSYLDLGNHVRYAPAEKWVETLSDQIVKMHIKDFRINRDAKNGGAFVRIGDGSIDWRRVRCAIERAGCSGWVSIESSGWTDAEHSAIMDRFFNGTLTPRQTKRGEKENA
jgi:hexulose-6-phosphate isomerase